MNPARSEEEQKIIDEFCSICDFYKQAEPCYLKTLKGDVQLINARGGSCGLAHVDGREAYIIQDVVTFTDTDDYEEVSRASLATR